MTIRRAALYTGGGTLLVAWFSSAASVSLQWNPRPAQTASIDAVSPADDVAVDMQAQAETPPAATRSGAASSTTSPKSVHVQNRRAAAACRERSSRRDPTAGGDPRGAHAHTDRNGGRPQAAGRRSNRDDCHGGQDLIVAAVGDVVLQRYKVTAIGPDAIELADAVTGLARRLALQYQ